MKALHFGAGNIGRGFIGKLLADADVHVIFADVNEAVINEINEKKQYSVRVVDNGNDQIELVDGVSAIYSNDQAQVNSAIAEVDLITTAVGPNVLKIIAPGIAQGIQARLEKNSKPLNVIACENMVKATESLKEEVFKHLPEDLRAKVDEKVGFINSAVDRIVPQMEPDAENPLTVTVESFSEWIVDKTQFKGPVPDIKGMQLTDNLLAFIQRKLFTLNTGHAATAYLGKLKNITLIKDAILDAEIKESVKGVMKESGEVLIKRFSFDREAHYKYIDKIITRFENPYLADDVDRVGRQPIRKLSPNERLVKPLQGTLEYKTANTYLVKVIASAFSYKNAEDAQAVELQKYVADKGIKEAVEHYTQLTDPEVVNRIVEAYQAINK